MGRPLYDLHGQRATRPTTSSLPSSKRRSTFSNNSHTILDDAPHSSPRPSRPRPAFSRLRPSPSRRGHRRGHRRPLGSYPAGRGGPARDQLGSVYLARSSVPTLGPRDATGASASRGTAAICQCRTSAHDAGDGGTTMYGAVGIALVPSRGVSHAATASVRTASVSPGVPSQAARRGTDRAQRADVRGVAADGATVQRGHRELVAQAPPTKSSVSA